MADRLRALSARLESPRMRPVLLVSLVLFLLVGSAAAFAVAERLKLERSPVATPKIQRVLGPVCDCPKNTARFSFGLRHAERVSVSIVDANGRRIRLLLDNERRRPGRVNLTWDGRNEAGDIAHDGRYRLRVALHDLKRTITIPTPVRLDTRPPRLRLLDAEPNVFSPDGDRKADRVIYRYRSSEPGRVRIFVDGTLAVVARRPSGSAQVRWRGHLGGDVAADGSYATWLTAVDSAGNESRMTRTVVVTIRYVEIDAPQKVSRGGRLRFEIDADAKVVAWTLRTRSGERRLSGTAPPGVVEVRLPHRIRRGVYTLEATVPAGSAETTVRITR